MNCYFGLIRKRLLKNKTLDRCNSDNKKEDDADVILFIINSDIQIILLRELREPLLQELQLREQKPTCGCGVYGSSWQHLSP